MHPSGVARHVAGWHWSGAAACDLRPLAGREVTQLLRGYGVDLDRVVALERCADIAAQPDHVQRLRIPKLSLPAAFALDDPPPQSNAAKNLGLGTDERAPAGATERRSVAHRKIQSAVRVQTGAVAREPPVRGHTYSGRPHTIVPQ